MIKQCKSKTNTHMHQSLPNTVTKVCKYKYIDKNIIIQVLRDNHNDAAYIIKIYKKNKRFDNHLLIEIRNIPLTISAYPNNDTSN